MNNTVDIYKILVEYKKLYDTPFKAYSPMYGDVILEPLSRGDYNSAIRVLNCGSRQYTVNEYGYVTNEGDCMIYPSRDNRDWTSVSFASEEDTAISTHFINMIKRRAHNCLVCPIAPICKRINYISVDEGELLDICDVFINENNNNQ